VRPIFIRRDYLGYWEWRCRRCHSTGWNYASAARAYDHAIDHCMMRDYR
jgi:hypothetical protein